MNSVNISINEIELKRILRCKKDCLYNWTPNANIKAGDLVPVLCGEKESVIYSMRWGYNRFENGNLTPFARSETIVQKWGVNVQTGVIPIKGFHFKYIQQTKTPENYYVNEKNNEILFIACICLEKRTHFKRQLSVVLLSKDTMDNEILFPYNDRMPVLLKKESIQNWLKLKTIEKEKLMNFVKNDINFEEPKQIGPWINDSKNTREDIVLRSKEEWKIECDAATINWDAVSDLMAKNNF